MHKFGTLRWPDTAAVRYATEVPSPLREACMHCTELISDTDAGFVLPVVTMRGTHWEAIHEECWIRKNVGSFAHQMKRCSCYIKSGGDTDDPVDITKRQSARLAMFAFGERMKREPLEPA